MLLKKPITSGSVVSIKIINGDEIIARYESEDATTVTINRPLALTMGQGGLGMIPWVFLGESIGQDFSSPIDSLKESLWMNYLTYQLRSCLRDPKMESMLLRLLST
jgi:hypothetical protein